MLREEHPTPQRLARFRREYELTKSLASDRVIDVLGLETERHQPYIILEDFSARSLKQYLAQTTDHRTGLPLETFLYLAIEICKSLDQVHQGQLIHKDISPDNILYNPATGQVKLIDFGVSSALSRSRAVSSRHVEGAFLYISPEQTGRLNRLVDYRTDFYSLGATLYELLVGHPPFAGDDEMALIHSHLTQRPPAPRELRQDVPEAVSEIVLTMLHKDAEDRYQSIQGMLADLQRCQAQLQDSNLLAPFALKQQDRSDRFEVSQKLYGREAQRAVLADALSRVCDRGKELVLVAGYSGVGKTTLIRTIDQAVAQAGGYFISGKFEQFNHDRPYSGLALAFQALLRQIFTEGEESIAQWTSRLSECLAAHGQVVVDVVPDLVKLIGPQPPLKPLPPQEAQNRFRAVFRQFIGACAEKDRPLILFLDDLQWADASSLALIETLLNAPEAEHVLIVGAYRDNEVDANHPLMLMAEHVRRADLSCHSLSLQPLQPEDVRQLLADTLSRTATEIQDLADRAFAKTQGNPFFLNQFLYALHEAGSIAYDRVRGQWTYDLAQIEQMQVTDNVVDLMIERIRQLPEDTLQVLQLAACMGNQFDLHTLSLVYEKTPRQTAADLQAAWMERIVVSLDDAHQDMAYMNWDETGESAPNPGYAFLHDRVQQAAYSLIDPGALAPRHLKVARLLLADTQDAEQDERLFEIVDHFNQGLALVEESQERDRLLRLNLAAGQRAKTSVAYAPAHHYMTVSLDLLSEACWSADYDLALEVYDAAAEAAFLSTHFEIMDQLLAVALQHTATVLDQVKFHEIQYRAYVAQSRPLDTVATGLQMLKLLKVPLPQKPHTGHVVWSLLRLHTKLGHKAIERLPDLPEMSDPHMLAAMRIMKGMLASAYFTSPNLFILLVFKMVRLSLAHGNAESSPMAYSTYAIVVSAKLGKAATGYRLGQKALQIADDLQAESVRAATLNAAGMADIWSQPLGDLVPRQRAIYHAGLMNGDFEYAAYGAIQYSYYAYFAGVNLNDLEPELATLCEATQTLGVHSTVLVEKICWQAVRNLMGHSATPWRLDGEICGVAEDIRAVFLGAKDEISTCFMYANELVLCYTFEQFDEALAADQAMRSHMKSLVPELYFTVWNFYSSLNLLALYGGASKDQRKASLKTVGKNQKQLGTWAKGAAANYAHKHDLVAAELARVRGQIDRARQLYERAIETSHQSGFAQEEALANELYGKFWLQQNDRPRAEQYLTRAHYVFGLWGATAKLKDLEARYPNALANAIQQAAPAVAKPPSEEGISNDALDLTTVVKAGQVLSGEIALGELLNKLMQVVLENAGAQNSVLVLKKDDGWLIEAEHRADRISVLQSVPLIEQEDNDAVPFALLSYVARSGDSLVLDHAADAGLFTQDPYVVARQTRSVLCMPLHNQGRMIGILYLENDAAIGAFTEDRIEVLNLLAAQAAISIENAGLYGQLSDANQTLEKRVAERTEELTARTAELEQSNRDLQQANLLQQKAEADRDRSEQRLREVSGQVAAQWSIDEIRGESPAVQQILTQVEQLQNAHAASVLIVGESGTGKELVARAIHYGGSRADRPFVAVNCSAIPADLMESSFFGHVAGAFTGASKRREGFFVQADGGTLFLDELGDMSVDLQAKLLRVLEDGVVVPIGGHQARQVDVRVLAATNADLQQKMEAGLFREDFYYRLARAVVEIPPLRERREDIPILAEHFLGLLSEEMGVPKPQFSHEALLVLKSNDFSGNIRELKNVLEFALIQNGGTTILPAHLHFNTLRPGTTAPTLPSTDQPPSLQQPAEPVLTEEQQVEALILQYVQINGAISNAQCRELLKVDRRRATYLLEKLCTSGRLRMTGSRRWAQYEWAAD